MIDSTYVTCIFNGYPLIKQFDKYLVHLESELCHEMLPLPLQSVAVRGLMTITGLDLSGWHKLQQDILLMIDSDKCENLEDVKDNIAEWKEYFYKLLKFLEIIPDESLHFYDDEVKEDIRPLCEWGNYLIKELIQWMQSVQDIDNAMSYNQKSTVVISK